MASLLTSSSACPFKNPFDGSAQKKREQQMKHTAALWVVNHSRVTLENRSCRFFGNANLMLAT